MKELIQLLQVWKDQGAIKPNGLLKENDIQILIDKMQSECQILPIPTVGPCPTCENPYPHMRLDESFYCDECGSEWA
jgi:predicted amidophosphoribosyltransferase